MNSLLTANDFIFSLVKASRNEYNAILEQACENPQLFEPFTNWSSEKYTRNCLFRNTKFELILLCWEAGQQTTIHNHGGEECWLGVLKGELEEQHFLECDEGLLDMIQKEALQEGRVTYINDKLGIHRLGNTSERRAMTLHLYANPIDECQYYCEESKGFKAKVLTYDSMLANSTTESD